MTPSEATTPPSVIAEILNGEGMTLADAARLCPASRGRGKVSPTTLLRWITEGALRYDGTKVTLSAARYGNRWMVSKGSLARFIQALTPAVSSMPPPTTTASTTPDKRRVKKATEKLVASGA